MTAPVATPWERGRFDGRTAPSQMLFGQMYEDASIELDAFAPGGRVMCIASAGCTAMRLAQNHDVVALDINPDQLAYAERRLAGAPAMRGTAERVMAFGRAFAPLVGWSAPRLRAFLELDDPAEQLVFWEQQLDTRRFRVAVDALFSVSALRAVYASPFLRFLPRRFGAVMRARMARGFARHPNRGNPYARALLLGHITAEPPSARSGTIRLVHGDAAAWLESAPAASLDGFALSNILDGVDDDYRARLFAAVKRAAAPGATVVLRSFAESDELLPTNHAADDRSMLWGVVDVRPAAALDGAA